MRNVFARQRTSPSAASAPPCVAVSSTEGNGRRHSYRNLVSQYGGRCDWLKDDQFLRDLEGDSVDAEILDEELRLLEEQEPRTCRGKTARILEMSPLQIAMCVLVLIDTGVVIAEILLDLHAMRSQQRTATSDLLEAMLFLKDHYANDMVDYNGEGIHHVLEKIRARHRNGSQDDSTPQRQCTTEVLHHQDHHWTEPSNKTKHSKRSTSLLDEESREEEEDSSSQEVLRRSHLQSYANVLLPTTRTVARNDLEPHRSGQVPENRPAGRGWKRGNRRRRLPRDALTFDRESPANQGDTTTTTIASTTTTTADAVVVVGAQSPETLYVTIAGEQTKKRRSSASFDDVDMTSSTDMFTIRNGYAEKLLKIAHILHYGSIAILGVFVIQVFLKIFGMGSEFFKNKLEVFDGIVIMASFTIDLVFVEGITGAEGEEAIALIIIFLLWRILRVINGMMVTAKKRQEFRIKLQKRACRRAEKKLECLEDEISQKEKEINNMKNLCVKMGASDEEISRCRPKRSPFFAKMDTSAGLSSIASLSLGFTMSMRSSDTGTRLPFARSLVSLSGGGGGQQQRPAVNDAPHSLGTPVSSLRHPRSRKPSVYSSSVSDRSSISIRHFSESRSMEKISEELSRNLHGLPLGLPSSTSMQSLAATADCSVQKIFPNRVVGADDTVTTTPGQVPGQSNGRPQANNCRNAAGELEPVGVSEICIVISDATTLTPTNTDPKRLGQDESGELTLNLTEPGDRRKSSLADSVISSPDESGKTVHFYVGTPVSVSVENLADQAASRDLSNDLQSSSSSQIVNGPSAPRASAAAVSAPHKGATASLAFRWLSKIRSSVRWRPHQDSCSVSDTNSEKALKKSVFVTSFNSTKKGKTKKTKETFL